MLRYNRPSDCTLDQTKIPSRAVDWHARSAILEQIYNDRGGVTVDMRDAHAQQAGSEIEVARAWVMVYAGDGIPAVYQLNAQRLGEMGHVLWVTLWPRRILIQMVAEIRRPPIKSKLVRGSGPLSHFGRELQTDVSGSRELDLLPCEAAGRVNCALRLDGMWRQDTRDAQQSAHAHETYPSHVKCSPIKACSRHLQIPLHSRASCRGFRALTVDQALPNSHVPLRV